MHNHDRNLAAFLQRCTDRGIHLNADKIKLRQHEPPFIGHIASDKGLRAAPTKIRAIREMPPPTEVAGVQRLLGMIQYLSKFLPSLSDMTKPLRELTGKEVAWAWDQPQQEVLDALKGAVASTPVLHYYSLQEEVTLQCDASQHGSPQARWSASCVCVESPHITGNTLRPDRKGVARHRVCVQPF